MNKRQILTTILSVLLSVFLVAGVVYAVTTISATTVTLDTISIGSTTTGITAGASTDIEWTGTSEWMKIFLENQSATTGSSAAVIGLTNAGNITAGDQITLELKNDLVDATTHSGNYMTHLTTLRARIKFKTGSTYGGGAQVQPIFATLGAETGVTLSGGNGGLRAGLFQVWLRSEPAGHVSILRLENMCGTGGNENYVDSHIYFEGGGSLFAMEFDGTGKTSWSLTSDTDEGFIKVKVGGATRYIKLQDAH